MSSLAYASRERSERATGVYDTIFLYTSSNEQYHLSGQVHVSHVLSEIPAESYMADERRPRQTRLLAVSLDGEPASAIEEAAEILRMLSLA